MNGFEAQVRKADSGWEWRVVRDGQTVERQVYDGWGPRRCHGTTLTRWGARRMAFGTIQALTRQAAPAKPWEKA